MTLRQQLEAILKDNLLHGLVSAASREVKVDPGKWHNVKVEIKDEDLGVLHETVDKLEALCQELAREAEIKTLRSIDCIVYDPADLERYLDERIAKLTQKPPQPDQTKS